MKMSGSNTLVVGQQNDGFTAAQLETFFAVADTVFPSLTGDDALTDLTYDLQHQLGSRTREEWDDIIRFAMECPSKSEEFRERAPKGLAKSLSKTQFNELKFLLDMLGNKAGSLVLCGTMTPFHQLPLAERTRILQSWKSSSLAVFQKAFKGIVPLIQFYYSQTRTFQKGIGFPSLDTEIHCPERYGRKKFHKFRFEDFSNVDEVTVDVIIVGTGAGGGVTAKNISQWAQHHGRKLSVLVLEKGRHYPHEDLTMTEGEAAEAMYERGLVMASEDGGVSFVAGSTFGGGTAVNWSASLETPGMVRREFAEEFGIEWYMSQKYHESLQRVQRRMGVSAAHLEHNIPNQLLINGARKLGFAISDVPQNTGGMKHSCGYCGNGCRYGEKQGTSNSFLIDASKAGVRFVQEAFVEQVNFEEDKSGKSWLPVPGSKKKRITTGVTCLIGNEFSKAGRRKVKINAKKVIIAAGSIHTPAILLRSGLKNPQIGANLRIHPTTFFYGFFPPSTQPPTKPFIGPILSTVITETASISPPPYFQYGSRIETPSMQPTLGLAQIPWNSGSEFKKLLALYTQCVSIFSIARDGRRPPPTASSTSGGVLLPGNTNPILAPEPECGRVKLDLDSRLPSISYTLTPEDRESLVQGLVVAAQTLISAGASMLVPNIRTGKIYNVPEDDSPNSPQGGVNNPAFHLWLDEFSKTASQPGQLPIGTAHQMGTCRMSSIPWELADEYGVIPATSTEWVGYLVANAAGGVSGGNSMPRKPGKPGAVDLEGRVYGVEGLWVMDGSVLPGATGVNPMVSIMAVADLLSRELCEKWLREGYRGGDGVGMYSGPPALDDSGLLRAKM